MLSAWGIEPTDPHRHMPLPAAGVETCKCPSHVVVLQGAMVPSAQTHSGGSLDLQVQGGFLGSCFQVT